MSQQVIETVECLSCLETVDPANCQKFSEIAWVCGACLDKYEDEGYYQCECDYNTNEDPPGLWGQCYEQATDIENGRMFCITHAYWARHPGTCANGCGRGITYDRFERIFTSTGGGDEVLCRRCAKQLGGLLLE